MKYQVKNFEVGPIGTNCYFLMNEDTKELLVIDPGGDGPRLIREIRQLGYTPAAVLLTHGHFDHAMSAKELKDTFSISVYAHEKEKETLENPMYNVSGMIGKVQKYEADIFVKDNDVLELAGFSLKVLHTPGHTPGGVSYYAEEQKLVFSGDALFCQSIGRTDFPNGSTSQLIRSVSEKLLTLPDDVQVLPGHEQLTTVGFEKQYNPYF
ncbi:MAG: MBL fold metallo-hydrolase [Eubacterium sp.]|nr:MBL fold metallo-hydrolase [Eubacterium sp.]